MPAFNSKVAELASALTLQAPGADAPLDVLGDWGHEVVRFLVSPIALQTFSSLTVVLCLDLARH
jgi:hypothetical protein